MRWFCLGLVLLLACDVRAGDLFNEQKTCQVSDGTAGGGQFVVVTPDECQRLNKEASDQRALTSFKPLTADQRAALDAKVKQGQTFNPDVDFLSSFSRAPLDGRKLVYDRIDLMTERDMSELSKGDIDTFVCLRVAKMIDTQRLYEKIGSHGIYNMDTLMQAGPKECRPFLRDMARAPL